MLCLALYDTLLMEQEEVIGLDKTNNILTKKRNKKKGLAVRWEREEIVSEMV